MKFLIDQNRSPRLAELLRISGHNAVHASELGLERAEDRELLMLATDEGRILVSGDTDFGALLAMSRATLPSVILFRARHMTRAQHQAEVILQYLDEVAEELDHGAILVITDDRIRIRRLPLFDAE